MKHSLHFFFALFVYMNFRGTPKGRAMLHQKKNWQKNNWYLSSGKRGWSQIKVLPTLICKLDNQAANTARPLARVLMLPSNTEKLESDAKEYTYN